jgi:hypothetical protein
MRLLEPVPGFVEADPTGSGGERGGVLVGGGAEFGG